MKNKKFLSKQRRSRKTRAKIAELNVPRLSVHRTLKHIYAQVISSDGAKVLASASTVEKSIRESLNNGGNIKAAIEVGSIVAKRAIEAGVKRVAFDRSGLRYHGRVKALADAAREGGVEF